MSTQDDGSGSDLGWSAGGSAQPNPWQPPSFAPPSFGAAAPVSDDAPTASVVPAAQATPKRGKGKVIGGAIAVLALLGGGGFAVSRIVAGNDGGAGSPTEAGQKFMDALGQEDVLGVVDVLLPGERTTFRQPLIDLVDNLKRLDVADDSATLDKVGGIDLSFEDLNVTSRTTNVDDVADIDISGTGTASVDGAKVPIGQLLIDEAFGGERPNLDSPPSTDAFDWHLATVKEDGRWYVSLFYSIAEQARPEGTDIPEHGIVAHGADSPEGAVQALLDGVSDLDLEAIVAAVNPDEAQALQRYAPIFIDQAQSALDDAGFEVSFSDVKYTVSGSGDRRTVAIDGFKMHAAGGEQDVTVDVGHGCTTITTNGESVDSCSDGNSVDDMMKSLGLDDNEDVQNLVKTVQDAFADLKPAGITVQQVDGQWYLSPIGTSIDEMLAVLSALDKNELTDIIDGVKKLAAGGWSAFPGESISASGSDPSGSDSSGSGSSDALAACYAMSNYTTFTDCIASGIQSGSIDPTFVPAYFRFVDCDAGQPYYDGSVYTMTDEEFVAFAEAKAPCFQQHVADGTVLTFELPYELAKPECLEGKNWYGSTDQSYLERVYDCVS